MADHRKRRVLEAQLQVPDRWMAALGQVVGSATRSGRLPKDASSWLVDRSPQNRRSSDASPEPPPPAPPPPTKEPRGGGDVAPSSRTGRVIPATNRFRNGSSDDRAPAGDRPSPPPVKAKGGRKDDSDADAPVDWAHARSDRKKGTLSRMWHGLMGTDPETGLKVPKRQRLRAPGGAVGKARIPDFSRISDEPGEDRPYRSPFSGIDLPKDDDGEEDPQVRDVANSLGKFKRAARKPPAGKDDFDDTDTDPDADPLGTKGESRLVRIFARK